MMSSIKTFFHVASTVQRWKMTTCYRPEGLAALAVRLHVMLQRGRLALSQSVDVQDRHQVIQLVVGGKGHGLPHGAF